MADPIDEIFNGTPDGIDEEELLEINAAQQQRQTEIEAMQETLSPNTCLLYTSPSPRDRQKSRMPSSA